MRTSSQRKKELHADKQRAENVRGYDAGGHEGLITRDSNASPTGDRIMAEEWWEEFGFRFGPFEFGVSGLGQFMKHTRTETSHIMRIRIDPAVNKEEIKARLLRPGLLEIEWPRAKGEEIPVE
jgi:hypothetical protein